MIDDLDLYFGGKGKNMKLFIYKNIIDEYYKLKKRDCVGELCKFFPDVVPETLSSIVAQEYQRKIKRSYHYHASPQNVSKYYQRYLQEAETANKKCGFLLKMADEVNFSPALFAKLIFEHHCKVLPDDKEPEKIDSSNKTKIAELLKNTSLIQDKHLATEIRQCILADEHYGPISDVIRNSGGLEYENKLKDELSALGISFIDEKQLREKGYDKTPDVKLDIPIVLDGRVINWIESKASFGDEERHKEYLRDQYWSYCNRFGPGLVIYWFGFIEELNAYKEQGIIISDKVPTQITHMDPSLLVKRTYMDNVS